MALISLPPATAAEREKGLFPANEGGTRCSPQVSTGTVWTGGLITTETKVLSLLPLTPRSLGRLMLGPPLSICVGGSLGFSLHLCSHDWGGGYRQDLWHLAGAKWLLYKSLLSGQATVFCLCFCWGFCSYCSCLSVFPSCWLLLLSSTYVRQKES